MGILDRSVILHFCKTVPLKEHIALAALLKRIGRLNANYFSDCSPRSLQVVGVSIMPRHGCWRIAYEVKRCPEVLVDELLTANCDGEGVIAFSDEWLGEKVNSAIAEQS